MIKQKIKDRLEELKKEILVNKKITTIPEHEQELALMHLKSEETTLNWVLLLMEQESDSNDGMRSKEEIKSYIKHMKKSISQTLKDIKHRTKIEHDLYAQEIKPLCEQIINWKCTIHALEWVLNEQEDKRT